MSGSSDGETLDLEEQRTLVTVLRRLGTDADPVRIGRYELGERLGRGAFGQVYVARDPELHREVAIKIVAAGRTADSSAEKRLLREGQALAKLQHPNVVPVYDVGVDRLGNRTDGRERRGVFVVMERVRGQTLAAWQREPGRTHAEILAAYCDAARGLAAAHVAGVVHRDFKPANAIVNEAGTVIVIDFGLATALDDASSGSAPSPSEERSSGQGVGALTETGTVMGTPRYMAPEQHAARAAVPASDQYAWCIALWEALSGSAPFRAHEYAELVALKVAAELPVAPAIPSALRRVLARGLRPDPRERFGSMTELLEALQARPWRRRALVVAATLALGALAAAIATRPAPLPTLCTEALTNPPWHAERIAGIDARLRDGPKRVGPIYYEQARLRQERFGARWEEARADMCDPARADEHVHARAQCLERALAAFDRALATIEREPAADRPWLLDLWTLPLPRRCVEGDAALELAADAHAGAEVQRVRREIERLMFEVPLPPPEDMPQTIASAISIAEAIHEPTLGVIARFCDARYGIVRGDRLNAADRAIETAWLAQSEGDDLLATEILVEGLGYPIAPGTPPEAVDRLVRSAERIAAQLGDPPSLDAELQRARAEARELHGDFEGALAIHFALAVRLAADDHPRAQELRFKALGKSASLCSDLGRPWAAQAHYAGAIAIAPSTELQSAYLLDLHAQLARASIQVGDFDTAVDAALRATAALTDPRTSRGRALGSVSVYGWALALRGAPEEGRAHMIAALDERRRVGEAYVSESLWHLAMLAMLQGHATEAIPRVDELRRIDADAAADVGDAWAWLAELHARAGDIARAADALAHAEASTAAPTRLAIARAEVALARSDFAAAHTHVLTALARPELHDGTPLRRGDLGEHYEVLARALAGLGRTGEAAAVHELAAMAYAGADALRRPRAQRVGG